MTLHGPAAGCDDPLHAIAYRFSDAEQNRLRVARWASRSSRRAQAPQVFPLAVGGEAEWSSFRLMRSASQTSAH
jgi:hypothetical protein